jgi:hypothetical protein
MNTVLDESLVGLVLLVSAGYALISLGPKSLRRRVLASLSGAMARAPAFLGLRRAAGRLAAAATVNAAGACGGCDSCDSEQAAPKSTARKSPPAEVAVPVSKIGRRA